MDDGEQELFGRTVDVSNVDKVLFGDGGATKGDLVDYYARIAETMVAHAADRPLAVKRFPDGIDAQGFFQKNAGSHYPEWLRRQDVPKREGGTLDHVVLDEPATIAYLADQAAIEFHPWLATVDHPDHPVEVVFDLDPSTDDDVDTVRAATRHVHSILEELDAPCRIKTSGSRGFHLHVPLDASADVEATRAWASDVADLAVQRHPDVLTVAHRKADRAGRVFVDWLRNGYGQTSVAAYSVRALPDAPVATPIDVEELTDATPRRWTIANLFRRLGQRDDAWADPPAPVPLADLRARLDELTVGGA